MRRNEIRLHNLKLLVEEFGTIAALSEACGMSEKYLSQLLSKSPLPSGRARGVGNQAAERLEAGTHKPPGWMDTNRSETASSAPAITPAEAELLRLFRSSGKAKRRAILAVARLTTNDAERQ